MFCCFQWRIQSRIVSACLCFTQDFRIMMWLPTYLEGQGDLVSRLKIGRKKVTIWAIGVVNLLTKSL